MEVVAERIRHRLGLLVWQKKKKKRKEKKKTSVENCESYICRLCEEQ